MGSGGEHTPDFARFLIAELEQYRDADGKAISIAELARRLGDARYAVVARWLDKDPKNRVVPSPEYCHKIADALGLDEIQVLRAAGHVRMKAPGGGGPRPPHYDEVRAIAHRLKRFGLAVPPDDWALIRPLIEANLDYIHNAIDRTLDAVHERERHAADGSS